MTTPGPAEITPARAETEAGSAPRFWLLHRPSVRLEATLAVLGGIALSFVMRWSVLRHLRTGVPKDLGDPLLQVWQLAWGPHALLHSPTQIWDSNTFYPLSRSLAFSDSLLGYAPLGLLFGSGTGNALLRYNVIFLLTYALAFAGTYALARQLGTSRLAATLAGIGFAYAPWHFAQEGHLQILSDGGIPLALALLARGHGYGRSARGRVRPLLIVLGWLVAGWQVSLGFGLGLQLSYVLGALTVIYGLCWLWDRRRGVIQDPLWRRLVLAELGGMAVFLALAAVFAGPYLQVAHDHPEAKRTVQDLKIFSPPLTGFVTVPSASWLWSGHQTEQRKALTFEAEMALAPGGTLVVLAVFGALVGRWPRRRRLGMAAGGLGLLAFAMGTKLAGGKSTYLLLFDHAPGGQAVRTPGRLVVSLTLVLALLAAIGLDRLRERRGRRISAGVAVVALALVGLEVLGTTPVQKPPTLPAALNHATGPLLVLPTDTFFDNWSMYWSTAGLYPIANGNSGFTPTVQAALRSNVRGFPDALSVAALQRAGIRQVVLLPALTNNSPWRYAASRSIAGLPLTRTQLGNAIVYDVAPAR